MLKYYKKQQRWLDFFFFFSPLKQFGLFQNISKFVGNLFSKKKTHKINKKKAYAFQ